MTTERTYLTFLSKVKTILEYVMNIITRPRRNRQSKAVREAFAETQVRKEKLIQPIFVANKTKDIQAIPGQKKYSLEDFESLCKERLSKSEIMGILLFASVEEEKKTPDAKEALNPEGLLPQAVKIARKCCPQLEVMTDVALDPFSSDGHDGLVEEGKVVNDKSVEVLKKMALMHAQAGATWVAPSDMMDGRVLAIRQELDENGFSDVGILSYTAKYASYFYGPFREALASAPRAGDKSTYQMDFRNSREAMRELYEDLQEGADMVMVKPGLPYLDIIYRMSSESPVPVAAYHVSGEYAMIKLAGEKGLVNGKKLELEVLTSFFRAGADVVVTYGALDL